MCYKLFKFVDRASLNDVEMKIQTAWAASHDRAAFLTGTILLFEQAFEKARPLIERCANSNSHNPTVFSF
jgi:hypothetical protein